MADADQQETSQDNAENKSAPTGTKIDQQLAEIANMLAAQNAQMQATQEALAAAAAANKPPKQATEVPDPVYDRDGYTRYVDQRADQIAQRAVARERALNTVVYQMSQDYPEIATDAAIKKTIQEYQRALPEALRETADGYETAILKAAHKHGLVPKSKRANSQIDEDISMGSERGSQGSQRTKGGKVKVS